MRVALINPSFSKYGGLSGHGGSMAPINLCYLAAYGRQQHPDVEFKIIDSDVHGHSHEETTDEVAKFDPMLIGITANTCAFDSVIQLSKRLKNRFPKSKLIIGGSHPSALPEQFLNETEETMKQTISFAKHLNTEIAAFFIASPLPGTPFYKEALEKGYVKKDTSWINFSPLSNEQGVISYPDLSAETIRKWHRKAIRSYYLRLAYILRRLYSLRHWHEVENLFAGLKLFLNIKN